MIWGLGASIVLLAAMLIWVVAEDLLGRLAAGAALFALFATPLGVGVIVERITGRFARSVRAEQVALVLTPVCCFVAVGLMVTTYAKPTGNALSRLPARHSWMGGAPGAAIARIGQLLAGQSALAPSSQPSSSAPELAPDGPPPEPRREAAPDAEAEAFTSGDRSYTEELTCDTLSDITPIERAYVPGAKRAAVYALAKARYPAGQPFLEAQNDAQLSAWFSGAPDSFDGVGSRFDAAVHEGAHIWSFRRFSLATQTYPVRAGLNVAARRLRNFPRSEISSVHVDRDADQYAKIYLDGASGAQGFNSLLDEYNAYAHSLAARYCTRDLIGPSSRVSARDGILTFMYYVETYLELARTRHPKDYEAILADSGHRSLILTVWDRAEHWLRKSAAEERLGIADRTIRGWVYEPARLEEIRRVRQGSGRDTEPRTVSPTR